MVDPLKDKEKMLRADAESYAAVVQLNRINVLFKNKQIKY